MLQEKKKKGEKKGANRDAQISDLDLLPCGSHHGWMIRVYILREVDLLIAWAGFLSRRVELFGVWPVEDRAHQTIFSCWFYYALQAIIL